LYLIKLCIPGDNIVTDRGVISTGVLLDIFNAAFISATIFAFSTVGLFILYLNSAVYSVYIAVILIGLAFGAESDVIAYMVSRYFSLLHMSEIYGYFYSIYILGAVLGPLSMGAAYDMLGNYQYALILLAVLVLIASLLLARLGYIQPDKKYHRDISFT